MKKTGFFSTLTMLSFLAGAPCVPGQPSMFDATFPPGTGLGGSYPYPYSLVEQGDGKLLIVGPFTSFGGVTRNKVARLNADGSLDTGFDPGEGPGSDNILCAAVQQDGKVWIGGAFQAINGNRRQSIARLRADGSLDIGLDVKMGAWSEVRTILVQPDTKIVVAGTFGQINSTVIYNIARLNPGGSLDDSFNQGSGPNGAVIQVVPQGDAGLFIVGGFNSVNGTNRNSIARLTTAGSLDPSFNPDPMNGPVSRVALQQDGKVVVVGSFSSVNGYTRYGVARLNTDGTLDTGFKPGLVHYDGTSVALQPDGKVLIGQSRGIARLNPDGSPDASFICGSGTDNPITTLLVRADGRILAAGEFRTFDGRICGGMVRLNALYLSVPNVLANGGCQLKVWTQRGRHLALQASANLLSWTTVADFITTNDVVSLTDAESSNHSMRFYRAIQLP